MQWCVIENDITTQAGPLYIYARSHHKVHISLGSPVMLKGGEYPEEGDEDDAKRLSDTKNQGLQRDHRLPRRLVHTCYGCTYKRKETTT